MLGVLALAGGQPLSRGDLVETLWADHPPSSAANMIQTYLKQLRRLLEPDRLTRTRSRILPMVGDGYALRLPPDDIDVLRFRRLVAAADEHGEPHRAAVLLGEGLAMWQGAPFSDVPALSRHPKVMSLSGERQTALTRYGEAMIAIGAAAEAVVVLSEAAAVQPLDEALQALLIRAHLATGQRSTAFAVYRAVRRRLAEELGVDPGPELAAAHSVLMNGTPRQWGPARTSLAQLPVAAPDFTGRAGQLRELDQLVAPHGTVAIAVISGTAGVGKTALAVNWAHQVRDRFPDGQLYVNLRGYDAEAPVSVGDALTRFLIALGVPEQRVPLDVEDRAARYRTELAGRRMLVVLDNAATADQVRPLLPGSADSVVVVTSRDSLTGLVTRHGATRLELDLLPLDDAVTLLRRLIGSTAEPHATAALARQCARLPLALRVAAEMAVSYGSLRELDVDLLEAGSDHRTAVRAVFSWSYRSLPTDVARAFRLFALHPGEDLDPYGAAALFDTGVAPARRLLDALSRAHLIQSTGTDRFGMHDLLRAYAVQRGGTDATVAERDAALTRLFDYYLAAAGTAATALSHHRVDPPGIPIPAFPDAGTARAWLDAERANLVAVIGHTVHHGWPAHTGRLAAVLYRYLDGGHYPDALTIHTQAEEAARQTGDRAGQAHALINLGSIYRLRGRYHVAATHYRRAYTLHRQTGDQRGQARALGNLGIVFGRLGYPSPATRCHRWALDLYGRAGDQLGQARAETNLGIIDERLGRFESARQLHEQALARYRAVGDQVCEAVSLSRLGLIDARLGRSGSARDIHRTALAYFRDIGHRRGEAHLRANLAALDVYLGHYESAAEGHREALSMFREIGDPQGETTALTGLGEALRRSGRPAEALTHLYTALTLATETCDRDEQAHAHSGLARTHHALGDTEEARRHWQRALTLYTALDAPEAGTARAALAGSDELTRVH